VRHSKTIQFGQRLLQIPFCCCSNRAICHVTALLLHITRSRAPSSAPLFSYLLNGTFRVLCHSEFVARLKRGLTEQGIDSKDYSGHSLRRGGCTLCFAAGLGLVDIKQRGDWRSMAFERYIHVPTEKIFSSARIISDFAAVE
jgi:hypothetical protein